MTTTEPRDPTGPSGVAAPRSEFIRRSHQRSAALGLSRGERCDFDPMVRSDLAVARERNRRLYVHAAPVMHMLFEQIVNTGSMIVLTDAQGTILHSVGDDEFLQRADKVALAPGENWAEHAKGTNAIGTALFEAVPTLVHAHEHFMHANSFLTCSAAPIMDPRGNMLGVLDVTGDERSYHQHTMGLVRMSARMIENHWLSDDCNNRLRLHLHPRAEFIGTLLEGILVVAPDGRVIGANRGALDQLGLDAGALRTHTLESLFGTTPAAVYDHFRLPMSAPMRLALPSGQVFHVSARFDWPSRPIVAGLGLADGAAAEPAPPRRAARVTEPRAAGLAAWGGGDAQAEALARKLERVLDRDIPLLLLGETGTGKELLARAAHHDSKRARRPFVALDCAAVAPAELEAELFGTGGAPGRLQQADGGTLFLDEVGDLPAPLQARLLRVLPERGARGPALICASRHDLREAVRCGRFRDDLYYRLNGLALRLPPLRERGDLDALCARLLRAERPLDPPVLAPPVLELFHRYAWPGNIRQLGNVLRSAAALAAGEACITTAHLPDDFLDDAASVAVAAPQGRAAIAPAVARHAYAAVRAAPETSPGGAAPTLEQAEVEIIRAALAAAGGNVSAASKQLGISRNTIYRKLRRRSPSS